MIDAVELSLGLFLWGVIGLIVFNRTLDKRWYWFVTLVILGILWVLLLVYPGILTSQSVMIEYYNSLAVVKPYPMGFVLGDIDKGMVFILVAFIFYRVLYTQFDGKYNLNLLPFHVIFSAIGVLAIAADNFVALIFSWSLFDLLLIFFEWREKVIRSEVVFRLVAVVSGFIVSNAYVGSIDINDLARVEFSSVLLILLILSRLIVFSNKDGDSITLPQFVSVVLGLALFWKVNSAGLSLGTTSEMLLMVSLILFTLSINMQYRQRLDSLHFWGLWVFLMIVGGKFGFVSNPVLWGAIGIFGFDCTDDVCKIIKTKDNQARLVGLLVISLILVLYLNNVDHFSQVSSTPSLIVLGLWLMILGYVSWRRLFYSAANFGDDRLPSGLGLGLATCVIVIVTVLSLVVRYLPVLDIGKLVYFVFLVIVFILVHFVQRIYSENFSRLARSLRPFFSLRWLIEVVNRVYHACRSGYESIRLVFESETGMFWTIVMLIAIAIYWMTVR